MFSKFITIEFDCGMIEQLKTRAQMKNVLIHDYFDTDRFSDWNDLRIILQSHFPELEVLKNNSQIELCVFSLGYRIWGLNYIFSKKPKSLWLDIRGENFRLTKSMSFTDFVLLRHFYKK